LQHLRLILYHISIPDDIYLMLLGLYIPVILLGSTLNLINLVIILSSTKLRR